MSNLSLIQVKDPVAGFSQALAALDGEIVGVLATVKRIERFRDAAAAEIERLQREIDAVGYFTEEQAAERFQLRNAASLADLRGQYQLPHCKIGGKVRYTQKHLDEIGEFFEVRKQGKGLRKVA